MTDWLLINGRWFPESKTPDHETEADAIRRVTDTLPEHPPWAPPLPPPDPEATAALVRILDARQPDPEGPGC